MRLQYICYHSSSIHSIGNNKHKLLGVGRSDGSCNPIAHIFYSIVLTVFHFFNRTFAFHDICAIARLSLPQVPELNRVAAGLAPCLFITPLDCYWEGSFLQEPDSPVVPVDIPTCERLAGGQNLTWGNLIIDHLRACLFAGVPEQYTPFIDGVWN